MWKCKECGNEVTVLATIPVLYEVFLDKNKKIFDFDDWKTKDLPNAKIEEVICKKCSKSGNIEEIAEWIEEGK